MPKIDEISIYKNSGNPLTNVGNKSVVSPLIIKCLKMRSH